MECAPVGGVEEGVTREDQGEDLEPMPALVIGWREQSAIVTGGRQKAREVDLEEILRDGPRALEIEPPTRAVRQNAPAQGATRQVLDAAQIVQHLCGGRRFFPASAGLAVERPRPTPRFHDGAAQFVALPILAKGIRARLGFGVGEQNAVGNIVAAKSGKVLLPQAMEPTKGLQNWPDQFVFGLGLVWTPRRERCPFRQVVERLIQEVAGKQVALKRRLIHRAGRLAGIPFPDSRAWGPSLGQSRSGARPHGDNQPATP